METTQRPADDLLDVARALLLLQGSILVATTIEALAWAIFFPGASGSPAVMSGAAAVAILVGRTRLRADRRLARRIVFLVEGVILLSATINVAIELALAHGLPPIVAVLSQIVLPVSAITLLRRSTRHPHTATTTGAGILQGAS